MLSNLSVNLVLKSIAKNEKKNKNIYFENHDQKVTRASKNWNLCLVALSWYIFVYLVTIVIDLPQGEVGVNLLEREGSYTSRKHNF